MSEPNKRTDAMDHELAEDIQKPASGEDDLIVWQAVGLVPEDEDSSKKQAVELVRQELLEVMLAQPTSWQAKRGWRRLSKVAVVGLVLALIGTAGWGVQGAVALQQRSRNRVFSQEVLSYALDIYEEDNLKLSEKAVLAEEQLPQIGRWSTDKVADNQMRACTEALSALATIRVGLPELGVQKLQRSVEFLMTPDHRSAIPELNLAFDVIASRACLEAFDTAGQRPIRNFDIKQVKEKAFVRLDSALLELQSANSSDLTTDARMLVAAMRIDLARGAVRGLHIADGNTADEDTIERQSSVVSEHLGAARRALEEMADRNDRWWVQYARLVNNEMLLELRKWRARDNYGNRFDDMTRQYELECEQIERFATKYLQATNRPRLNALRFELGICYSNLADLIEEGLDQQKIELNESWVKQHRKLRLAAIKKLNAVPHLSRSERHLENLTLNQSRLLYVDTHFAHTQGRLGEAKAALRGQALGLESLVGNFLVSEVGQFPVAARMIAAWHLPEHYPHDSVFERYPSYEMSLSEDAREFVEALYSLD